jgi:predicted RNase H-like nuclease (RuvC/YqgF family)
MDRNGAMYLIAGIDPGKTCGMACLDLNGVLVYRDHMTFGGPDWLVARLNKIGTPVIIASDKPKAGEIVRKVNTAFNARLFCPDREFRIDEKRTAGKARGIKNPHERDAYMAAIAAYNAYANKFKQAEHIAGVSGISNIEEIKAKVVGRYSIKEAMENRRANRK